MGTQRDEVRRIDSGPAPTRFARGWHCLGLASRFAENGPHAIQAFGQKLVVFADSEGGINVLDSYCRHMGGDLSRGTIKGDQVACPFHDWRWGGDGRCKRIPYARRVPLRARTAAWPTLVQDGMLFVWNDPEGNPPIPEQAIPRIEAASREDYTDWLWYETVVDANCREVVDNVVDMAHFFYVHYSFPTFFKNIFEGHVATQLMRGLGRDDTYRKGSESARMLGNTSDASYFGPSFMLDELTYHYEHGDVESILINCHYPVTANRFVLQYGIMVRRAPHLPGDEAEATAEKMAEFIKTGFEQDVEIWKHKTRIDNPLLSEEDGPVYQLRRWYEQFYVDAGDVAPEMVDRFEFEIDTTRPVEAWRTEVAANVARRDGTAPPSSGAEAEAAARPR